MTCRENRSEPLPYPTPMPLPIVLTFAYLVVNLALMIWIERGRAGGHEPSSGLAGLSGALRWGPPLAGLVYLEAVAGDWVFFLFVIVFFAFAFYLLDSLLGYPSDRPKR
jgi:hypothetical protein